MGIERLQFIPAQPGYRAMFVNGYADEGAEPEEGQPNHAPPAPMLEYADVVMWGVATDLGAALGSALAAVVPLMRLGLDGLHGPPPLVPPAGGINVEAAAVGIEPPPADPDADTTQEKLRNAVLDAVEAIEAPAPFIFPLVACSDGSFGTLEDATEMEGFVRVLDPNDNPEEYLDEARLVLEHLGDEEDEEAEG